MRLKSALGLAGILAVTGTAPAIGRSGGDATATVRASLRTALSGYLTARRVPEHISAVSLTVNFRGPRPAINLAVGSTRYGGGRPVSTRALWQIGSNTKAFTAVLLLKLEAEHKLSIHDTLGKWLSQYPAWREVTIAQLLNMTSGIPSYTDLPTFLSDYATAPDQVFSAARLVDYATVFPLQPGYYYSNTAYVLAQMVIERVTHHNYADELRRRIIVPLGLRDMYYGAGHYPAAITARLPAGYYFAASQGPMAPQYGKNQSRYPMSWGQGAGGIVSSLQDMATWDRALYTGRELPPKQQRELETLVSEKTGKPIRTTTLTDSLGFGLGVEHATRADVGSVWVYQGQTWGFTVIHLYFPRSGTLFAFGLNSVPIPQDTPKLIRSLYRILHKAGLA